jgi:prostaglandin-H2 D-isomerase / glutathione transferase
MPTQTEGEPPKLIYFNGRGLAEVARLLFAAAGVKYTDVRINKLEEVDAALRPFRQVPVLVHHGNVIAQSGAINRHIARTYGLYGETPEEAAKIDMVYEAVLDVRQTEYALTKLPEEKKEAEKAIFASTTLPRWMGHFEQMLASNQGGRGFIVGRRISLADVSLQHMVGSLRPTYPKMLEGAPLLAAHHDRVSANPGIAAWIKARPQTSF